MDKEQIYKKLVAICGESDVSIDDADLMASGDWIARGLEALYDNVSFKAGFLVTPKEKQEIIEIVKYANEHIIPIIPRAANTSLAGQVLPLQENTIVIDIGKHMNKILEINLAEEYVVVEPGVEFWYLQEVLATVAFDRRKVTITAPYCEQRQEDPQIVALSKRIKVVGDPKLEKSRFSVHPGDPAIVEVETKDGKRFSEQVDDPKGETANPLTKEEIEEKADNREKDNEKYKGKD